MIQQLITNQQHLVNYDQQHLEIRTVLMAQTTEVSLIWADQVELSKQQMCRVLVLILSLNTREMVINTCLNRLRWKVNSNLVGQG